MQETLPFAGEGLTFEESAWNAAAIQDGFRTLAGGGFRQCHLHQLATPKDCYDCLRQRGQCLGSLHQAERALSGVGTQAYYDRLLRIVAHAEAVLVVNPHAEALVAPYARKVCVVTAGMDPGRFPWPEVEGRRALVPGSPVTVDSGKL